MVRKNIYNISLQVIPHINKWYILRSLDPELIVLLVCSNFLLFALSCLYVILCTNINFMEERINKVEKNVDNLEKKMKNMKKKVDDMGEKIDNLGTKIHNHMETKIEKIEIKLTICNIGNTGEEI